MHTVFAVSCIVMLVATIGMMVKDQTDEWRVYQKQGFNLSAATKKRDIDALRTEGYLATAERLKSEASRVEEALLLC